MFLLKLSFKFSFAISILIKHFLFFFYVLKKHVSFNQADLESRDFPQFFTFQSAIGALNEDTYIRVCLTLTLPHYEMNSYVYPRN